MPFSDRAAMDLKIAMGLFIASFVLSIAAMRYRKPGGKLISPVWKMKDNYQPRGVMLNVIALAGLAAGFIYYWMGTRH